MKLTLNAKSLQPFTEEIDSLSALLISDAVSKQLVSGRVDLGKWHKHLTTDELDGEMWLYAYEATLKGMTGGAAGDAFIARHPWFSHLYSRKIEFYRSGQGVLALDAALHRRKQENAASRKVTNNLASIFDDDFEAIDDLDFEDYDETY